MADPDVVNDNFTYLEELITDTSAKIYTNNSSLESKISTLSNSVDTKIQDLTDQVTGGITEDISDLNKNITNINNKITNIFDIIAPNYKAGFNISSGWTATKSGYVSWYSGGNDGGSATLWINGVEVGFHSSYKYTDPHRLLYMIRKGDKVTFSGKGCSAKFFPCQGGV